MYLFKYYLQIYRFVLAVKSNFLRKKMAKLEKFKEINYPKRYFQKVLPMAIQINLIQISLAEFVLQVLQSDYFVNLFTQKGNQNYFMEIS